MSKQKISRRQFLRVGTAAAAGAAVAACQPQTVIVEKEKVVEKEVTKVVAGTPVVEKVIEKVVETKVVEVEKEVTKIVEVQVTPTPAPLTSKESPLLSARVKSGMLPPLEERMLLEPLVVEPYEEIGQFGGTARVATTSTSLLGTDAGYIGVGATGEFYLRIAVDLKGTVPNVASSVEVNDDASVYTIHLRRGMKFSDGEPITADDAMFWYEDHFNNEEITPLKSANVSPRGVPLVVEKVDDYTIVHRFQTPYRVWMLSALAHYAGGGAQYLWPSHYLKEFHIKYNPKAGDLAKAEALDHWYQLYSRKQNAGLTQERPHTRAFSVVQVVPDAVFYERNPYSWQLDTEGNQLPYIDKISSIRVADLEMLNATIVSGEVDFAGWDANIVNYAAYSAAARDNNQRILLWNSGKGAEVLYNFNMTFDSDTVLRDIFRDVRFRRAMSLAINRDEINNVIYFGRAVARQMTVLPYSKYFKQEYADAWADYDVDQANALLDEMGLKWDAAHKLRVLPDGRPFQIFFDMYESETPKAAITELVKDYWEAIGVEINYKSITRALLAPKILANEEPMSLWHAAQGVDILLGMQRLFYVPHYGDEATWCPLWGQWYQTRGKQGQEPPQEIRDLFDWFDNYQETLGDEWAHNILQSQAENIWSVGTVGSAPHPLIVRNTLRNVPEEGVWAWDCYWSWPRYPEQFFLKA